jgi:hypothetical protein
MQMTKKGGEDELSWLKAMTNVRKNIFVVVEKIIVQVQKKLNK